MSRMWIFESWTAALLAHFLCSVFEHGDVQTEQGMLNYVAGGRSHKVDIVFENDLRKKMVIPLPL